MSEDTNGGTNTNIFIGIDPGSNGGVAVVREDGLVLDLWSLKGMPPYRVWEKLYEDTARRNGERRYFAALEQLVKHTGKRGADRGSRMAVYARSYGMLWMALEACRQLTGLTYVPDLSPRKWQGVFGLRKGRTESNSKWKGRIRAKARSLFPGVKGITLSTADALLIAEYSRRFLNPRYEVE